MLWIVENGLWLVPVFVAAMFAAIEAGRRIGISRALEGHPERAGTGTIEGAVFGLLALLIAFTFGGAAARFDDRRTLIVEEANDIGTAWLRIDLMSPAVQPALRDAFRRYVANRMHTYRPDATLATAQADLAQGAAIQNEIWRLAIAGGSAPDAKPNANQLMLAALNDMIDITTTRRMAIDMHPPPIIFVMLVVLALIAALMAGFAMSGSPSANWIHRCIFVSATTFAIYVIIDIEFPRRGLITVDSFDPVIANSIPPPAPMAGAK